MPKDRPALPVANDDDTVLEIAAMMAANRSPLVAVLDGKGKHAPLLGAVSIYDLLGGSCRRLPSERRSAVVGACAATPGRRDAAPPWSGGRARSTGCWRRPTPTPRCELDFDNPFELLVVTVLSAQTTDKRVNAVRPTLFAAYPDARRDGRGRPRRARGDHRPARLLPRQDRVAAQAQRRAGRAARRRGAAPAQGPGRAARRRPQDRQRRARQRLRHPRDHRRHPLRPAVAPVRLDRGDRPGQGRARRRRAVPQEGLGDAEPPPDLARPPLLPRPEAGLRRLPGGRAGARRTATGPTDPETAAKLLRTEGRA